MSKSEQRYCVTRKELLAVYYFVKQFKHYLLGRHFIIRTDHKALTWLLNWDRPNTSQYSTWISELEVFDFTIEHRSGNKHQNADFLSRLEECGQCGVCHREPKAKRNIKLIDDTEDKIGWMNCCDVQLSQQDKNDLLKMHHDMMGHIGCTKMLSVLKGKYTWPGVSRDVKNYVANCCGCAERKSAGRTRVIENLQITANKPFEKIMIDISGPLVKSKTGYQYILGIVDVFSRYIMIIPLKSTESKAIVKAMMTRWIAVFGCPDQVISDGGANLNSSLMQEFCTMFGIHKRKISPYHPQGNGIIEREFRTVKDMLYATCKSSGKDWPDALPHIEIGLRASVHSTTTFSPYEVIFGQQFLLPVMKTVPHLRHDYNISLTEHRENVQNEIRQQQKSFSINNNVDAQRKFKVGDSVMVQKVYDRKPGILDSRYFGPCKIVSCCGNLSYKLEYKNKFFWRNERYLKKFNGDLRLEKGTSEEGKFTYNGRGETGKSQLHHNCRYPIRNRQVVEK